MSKQESTQSEDAIVFRGWNRAALDAQLNLRARWPEHREAFEAWAADSRAVRESQPCHLDLAYGGSSGERLDIFPVPGVESAPLLVFIHGGYWQSLDKGDFSYLAPAFAEAGVAFASLNYDLAPKATVPQMVQQVRGALAWLSANAGQYGIDAGRIALSGHSAGGHLAVLAGEPGWMTNAGLDPETIKGVISISGVYDLEPIRLSYHQAVLRLSEEDARSCSPLRAGLESVAPLVLAVGSEETEEFQRQQAELVEASRRANRPVEVVALPGRQHFTACEALGERDHALYRAALALLEG